MHRYKETREEGLQQQIHDALGPLSTHQERKQELDPGGREKVSGNHRGTNCSPYLAALGENHEVVVGGGGDDDGPGFVGGQGVGGEDAAVLVDADLLPRRPHFPYGAMSRFSLGASKLHHLLQVSKEPQIGRAHV